MSCNNFEFWSMRGDVSPFCLDWEKEMKFWGLQIICDGAVHSLFFGTRDSGNIFRTLLIVVQGFQRNRCSALWLWCTARSWGHRIKIAQSVGNGKFKLHALIRRWFDHKTQSKRSDISNALTKWRIYTYFLKWGCQGRRCCSTICSFPPDTIYSMSESTPALVDMQSINSGRLMREAVRRGAFSLFSRTTLSSVFVCSALMSISCHHWLQIWSLWRERVTEESQGSTADHQCHSDVTFSDETVMALQICLHVCCCYMSVCSISVSVTFLHLLLIRGLRDLFFIHQTFITFSRNTSDVHDSM